MFSTSIHKNGRRSLFGVGCLIWLSLAGLAYSDAYEGSTSVLPVMLDHYIRPVPWYYNQVGGMRGPLGSSSITQTDATDYRYVMNVAGGYLGMWYSIGHSTGERIAYHPKAMFHPMIKTNYQAQLMGVDMVVTDCDSPAGRPDLKLRVEIKGFNYAQTGFPEVTWQSNEWIGRSSLTNGPFPKTYSFDANAAEISNVAVIVWVLDNVTSNDAIEVDSIGLRVKLPLLATADRAFLISLAMLLDNFDETTGMVKDKSYELRGFRENTTATAKLAKLLAMAMELGMVDTNAACSAITNIAHVFIHKMPRGPTGVNQLLPHFTMDGGTARHPDSEWSSGDTVYALEDLAIALQLIGDPQGQLAGVTNMFGQIDWQALLSPRDYFYHGYSTNGVRLTSCWDGFGVETFAVFLAALAGDGILTTNTFNPPSDNGSGFIYHASYPLVPEGTDRWGNAWTDLRQGECDTQINWYATLPHVNTNLYDLAFFGLSAAEDLSGTNYIAYGTGGKTSSYNDGDHQVVIPHYSGLIAPLRLANSTRMWESLESLGLLSPLNNVESLAMNSTNREKVTVNFLRGSWNLALQAEGWALSHTQVYTSAWRAFREIPSLYHAYETLMMPEVYSADLMVVGNNGEMIANGEAPSAEKGTDFGSLTIGGAVTNGLAISNAGKMTLTIAGLVTNGVGAAQFEVRDMPSTVEAGTVSNFSLIFRPTISGVHTAAVEIANNSTSTPYCIYLAGIGLKRPPAGITIWPSTTVPGLVDIGPDSAAELGVKFKSDLAGTITGIRFYKAAANTGVHVGNLWTSTGARLATVTFSNETASGWQQALFATPVTIVSNTVYVASYHANSGHYSEDDYYFQGKGMDNPPLHALADGVSGNNGVYAYGSSSVFPNQTWYAANYWVDVVFQAGSAPTLMSIAVTPANSNILIGATQQFTAMGTYSDGSTQNITSQATWTSSNTGVATINPTGLAMGISTGTTIISAALAGMVGSATLTVQAVPLVITTTSLPNGVSNTIYTTTLVASGGTMPYTWSVINGTLPAGLTLNSGSGIISGTPTVPGTFSFAVQVRDAGGRTASKTLGITIMSMPIGITIWPSTAAPGLVDIGPDSAAELGVKFRSDVAGTILGIRFYKATANIGVHVGNLWTSAGARLATVTFSNETASGWQQALFATPVTIASNTVYVASYHANSGHYSEDDYYFQGKGMDNPPLHALADGVSGNNGVYAYGSSSVFPNQTWYAANYWVDVVFQTGPAPTLLSIGVTPTNLTISMGGSQQFTATGTYSDGSTRNITSQATWTSSSSAVATIGTSGLAAGISAGTTTISVTMGGAIGATTLTVQAAPLVITTTSLPNGVMNTAYTATLAADGGTTPYTWSMISGILPLGLTLNAGAGVISGTPTAAGTFSFVVQVRDAGGKTMTKTLSIMITSLSATATIWSGMAAPGRVDDGPDKAVELGVKFKSDVAGTITGIRFYKATANTGVHVGNLWVSNGTQLATVIFSNETASGWQQALFATPVAIASNTVYVASYHANNGHYSADNYYFQGKGVDTPPLHALANGVSGGNGVYRYGANSVFPNQSWNAANYWVDVVFLAASPPPLLLTSLAGIVAGASTSEVATSTGAGNIERWPRMWTSGDLSKECGASNLTDGDTNTMWIGNVGGEPWRVILDLGAVTDVTGIQLMFLDTAWTNKEIIGSRDSEVWSDYLVETNEWVPLRYLYVNFWGDEHGAQPPAIREIIWRGR